MNVRFTTAAKMDLQEIGDYIAKDNPRRALSFVAELQQKSLELAASPRAFPLVPRYEKYGIRWRVHGNYLIFYRVNDEQIVVVHILHGAMDYAAVLFENQDNTR
ncbi:MAG: type II toxin-antitoxin system RelE/ParE family toxin [Pseudomonadales bacterium]|jgi:addiction module RelE/StbE family toxin|nr:type II toxin-antitoxin system RelE/ParE family toxin [Pseudomonadales bacterium]